MDMPKFLHEVLGEQQTWRSLLTVILFTVVICAPVFYLLYVPENLSAISWWKETLGVLLIIDVIAGCAANFTRGTNDYYATRASARWVFIGIHFHIFIIALAFDQPLDMSAYIWGYSILSAALLNCLFKGPFQKYVAMIVVMIGLFAINEMPLTLWYQIVASLFLVKVCYAFAVDHYHTQISEA